jgi:hypothetical protein
VREGPIDAKETNCRNLPHYQRVEAVRVGGGTGREQRGAIQDGWQPTGKILDGQQPVSSKTPPHNAGGEEGLMGESAGYRHYRMGCHRCGGGSPVSWGFWKCRKAGPGKLQIDRQVEGQRCVCGGLSSD